MKFITTLFFLSLITFCNSMFAQSVDGIDVKSPIDEQQTGNIELSLKLAREDWIYNLGEEAVFEMSATMDGIPLKHGTLSFTIGPEKMRPTTQGTVEIEDGSMEINGGTMKIPGFLRCEIDLEVNGHHYTKTATAGFAPEKIEPTTETPRDFENFWTTAIEQSRRVPLATELTPIPQRGNDSVDVFQVAYQFDNKGVRKFYGVLSVPKKDGKYPAIIRFPGAGWAPLSGDTQTAGMGFITLDLYIHGRPVMEDRQYYEELKNNELKDYMYKGIADRDSFYYKNVILGCVRAVDLIYSLPNFDGKNLGGWGSSQGGALSMITASLETRIDYFVALCPAMCDFTGYLFDRAGGWPHFFLKPELYEGRKERVVDALAYYDVVNFAKRIHHPGFFSWGFNDATTPPTSFYSAYNSVSAPKQVFIVPDGVHKIYPEQKKKTYRWLTENLTKSAD